jgi:formate dehydrogenase alpha subunit
MKITINGKVVETEGPKTILNVARDNGIYIPSLCDHEKLSPFTGCRMCLVEIKGRRGYPPSCGTYAEEGMEIVTDTPRLQKLRRHILELILSEHPNACLICAEKENCDEYKSTIRKVGEVTGCVLCSNNRRCELQDVVDAIQLEKVSFPSGYRDFEIKRGDPFFDRNYNLCILCGRCVRVCHELRGASAIAFVNRGPEEVVGTVLDKPLLESGCQFCGACVDVCPTGSLAERGIKYESLPDREAKTICPLCSMGCELDVWLKDGRILNTSPSSDGAINNGQACVKGRFLAREVVYSSRRVLAPLIKRKGEFEEVSWEEALDFVAAKLKTYKGKDIALIESSQLGCEDAFVVRKFARQGLKTNNIDTRKLFSPYEDLHSVCQKSESPTALNFDIKDISKAETIVLAGTDIVSSHPLIWLEVLKAVRDGSKLIVVSATEFLLNRFVWRWLRINPGTESLLFGFLAKLLLENTTSEETSSIGGYESVVESLEKLTSSDVVKLTGVEQKLLEEVAHLLRDGRPAVFLFGAGMAQFPSENVNVSAFRNLALLSKAKILPLVSACNQRGLFELARSSAVRAISKDQILQLVFQGDLKALYLVGSASLPEKMKAEFIVVQNSYMNEDATHADVILPAVTFAETEGIFVNGGGLAQKFQKVINPLGEAKPDWWILSQLAQKMKIKGFDYKKTEDILKEIKGSHVSFAKISYAALEKRKDIFITENHAGEPKLSPVKFDRVHVNPSKKFPFKMITSLNLDSYRNLSLSQENRGFKAVRNSQWVRMNPIDAEKLGLKNEDPIVVESENGKMEGLLKVSEGHPEGVVESQVAWSEEARVSGSFVVLPLSKGYYPHNPIPVNIKRGK